MNVIDSCPRCRTWLVAVALSALAAACGGKDQILGTNGIAALVPTVTAVTPLNSATGVLTNASVTATFNETMAPISGMATMTVTCAAPCTNPTGAVTLDPTNAIATFTLTSGTALATATNYTVTITGATSLASGTAMAGPYTWQFTTVGTPADVTRPRVSSTDPVTTNPGPTPGVPGNRAVIAVFTKHMAPATITGASVSVTCAAPCVSPAGSVSYSAGSSTAVFTPAAGLTVGDTYTATVTAAATDLAGNALAGNQAPLPAASNYVWTFIAAAPSATGSVSVLSTSPAGNATGVCPNASVNASFTVPSGSRIDPTTMTSTTFTVVGPPPSSTPVVATSVSLDPATGRIATFIPQSPLTAGEVYTATIEGGAGGVKDLAVPSDTMLANFTWDFTVAAAPCLTPIPLRSAAAFGNFGGSAGTTNTGILTVINGSVGTTAASTLVTGFHDTSPGCIYTETPADVGAVNGLIYTAPPPPAVMCPSEGTAVTAAIAMQARADALTAYNALVAFPGGPDPGAGNLANLTLAPGTYTAAAGSFKIQGGDLTLDAQGDANAVWVFQMATTLTVGGPGAAFPQSVLLVNGAQAKNVYWQVGSAATINAAGGGTMAGTIIAQAGAAFSTAGNTTIVTLDGRVLSLGGAVTLVDTVINVPGP
jgi:hypothetical protein